MVSEKLLNEAVQAFAFGYEIKEIVPYGNGNINDTFLVTFAIEKMGLLNIILQRLNTQVFTKPDELMENIINVTTFLQNKVIKSGGDPERETLNLIYTTNNQPYYVDLENNYWRAYKFIAGATCYNQVESAEDFYQSALAFGHFQKLLADYPAVTLHETILEFHNTKARFEYFKDVVAKDPFDRVKNVQNEISFVLAREDVTIALTNCNLPIRVTHNDTRLDNVMIDDKNHKGICVIDLDTVMPGLAVNDFGDSIRFGTSTSDEEWTDLNEIKCDMELFEIYTKGFIKGCAGTLTEAEIKALPLGAKVMTFECGIRFLTDYLEGDIYFKTDHEDQNLDRCWS